MSSHISLHEQKDKLHSNFRNEILTIFTLFYLYFFHLKSVASFTQIILDIISEFLKVAYLSIINFTQVFLSSLLAFYRNITKYNIVFHR